MKEKHNYKKQEIQHKGKNLRKWVCEQKEKKGWKSTSGVVPIILISSVISIANFMSWFLSGQDLPGKLCRIVLSVCAKVAKTLCHISGKTLCPSLSKFSTGSLKYQCLLAVLSSSFKRIKVIIRANSLLSYTGTFCNILFRSTIHGCSSMLSAGRLM